MTAVAAAGPSRPLAAVCEAVAQVPCGHCGQPAGGACTFAAGYHVARFAQAWRAGLITGRELVAALAMPDAFTTATVIRAGGAS